MPQSAKPWMRVPMKKWIRSRFITASILVLLIDISRQNAQIADWKTICTHSSIIQVLWKARNWTTRILLPWTPNQVSTREMKLPYAHTGEQMGGWWEYLMCWRTATARILTRRLTFFTGTFRGLPVGLWSSKTSSVWARLCIARKDSLFSMTAWKRPQALEVCVSSAGPWLEFSYQRVFPVQYQYVFLFFFRFSVRKHNLWPSYTIFRTARLLGHSIGYSCKCLSICSLKYSECGFFKWSLTQSPVICISKSGNRHPNTINEKRLLAQLQLKHIKYPLSCRIENCWKTTPLFHFLSQ